MFIYVFQHEKVVLKLIQFHSETQLNADGYGSHTSPTHQRSPLVPRDLGEDFSLDFDEEPLDPRKPKNAK